MAMAMAKEEGAGTAASLQQAASSSDAVVPAFFPTISRAPPHDARPIRKLNGSDDLLTRLRLMPLYNATAKQFLKPAPAPTSAGGEVGTAAAGTSAGGGKKPSDGSASNPTTAERGLKRPREEDSNNVGKDGTGGNTSKRRGMPKTMENYVADLPGRVMPPRRLLSKADYHEQTMREIIYRPETTIQNILPFDRETLESAFRVSAGDVPGIDMTLLESDQVETSSPRKKRPKKSKQKPPNKN